MALRGSGSDSDSDSDSFEAAMKRKSQKIANSVLNNEDLQYDIDTPATSEEKQDKQERGSRFLKDILKQKEIRDKERERELRSSGSERMLKVWCLNLTNTSS